VARSHLVHAVGKVTKGFAALTCGNASQQWSREMMLDCQRAIKTTIGVTIPT
jgi:hypothetical protein